MINPSNRINDYKNLTFTDFLEKYYSNESYPKWCRWNLWMDWVESAFDKNRFDIYKNKTGYYPKNKNSDDYISELRTITFEVQFPLDIQKVIVVLKIGGFFDNYKIDVNSWIKSKNYTNPYIKTTNNERSILDLLNTPESRNFLRESLIYLIWWDIINGR